MKSTTLILLAVALARAAPLFRPSDSVTAVGNAGSFAISARQVDLKPVARRSIIARQDDDFDDGDDDSGDDSGFDDGSDDSDNTGADDDNDDDEGDDGADDGDDTGLDDTSDDQGDDSGDDGSLDTGDDGTTADDGSADDGSLDNTDDGTDDGDDGLDNTDGLDDGTDDADDSTDTGDDTADGTDAADGTDNADGTDATDGTDNADGTDDTDNTDNADGTDDTTGDISGASNSTDTSGAGDDDSSDSDSTDDSTGTNSTTTATPSSATSNAANSNAAASQASAAAAPPASNSNTNGNCAAGATGPNDATVALIKQFEGFVPSPKPDPIGLPTAGFGHKCIKANCAEVPFSFPLSQATATQLLQQDASKFVNCLHGFISKSVTLNDNQFGALTSFAFNLGCGTVQTSTLLKRLNNGEDPNTVAAAEIPRFNKAGGKVSSGLARRRAAEVQLFQTPSSTVAHPLC